MKVIKNFFLSSSLVFVLLLSFQSTYAANIFGITDPPGCESKDIFLPNLVICGRSPATGACSAYTKPCTVGDLIETGSRAIVWLISAVLLVVPILLMYYGAQIIINAKDGGGGGVMKEIRKKLWVVILYFIFMLAAWLIVRTVVDIFQVEDRVPSFLIDENGNAVKARTFNTN